MSSIQINPIGLFPYPACFGILLVDHHLFLGVSEHMHLPHRVLYNAHVIHPHKWQLTCHFMALHLLQVKTMIFTILSKIKNHALQWNLFKFVIWIYYVINGVLIKNYINVCVDFASVATDLLGVCDFIYHGHPVGHTLTDVHCTRGHSLRVSTTGNICKSHFKVTII